PRSVDAGFGGGARGLAADRYRLVSGSAHPPRTAHGRRPAVPSLRPRAVGVRRVARRRQRGGASMDRSRGERSDDPRQYPHPGRRALRPHSVRRQRLRGRRRMRLRHRSILTAALVALSFALVGCETADVVDKLTDLIPFGDNKKPLPGERKEVFPQGVPGVPQGVPSDMIKGNQPPEATPPPQPAAAAPPPAEKPKPKKKVQAKP